MLKYRKLKFYIGLFFLSMGSMIHAGQPLQVVTENWAPFNYQQGVDIKGYSTAVVEEVLNEAGIPFQIRLGVWKGVYQKALDEPNVLIYTISRTKEREDKFHWIGPIAKREQALYKLRTRDDIKINNIEDAKNYRLVVQEKDSMAAFFERHGFTTDNPNYQLYPKQVLGLRMLLADHVDVIPVHPLALKYEMGEKGLDENRVEKVISLPVEGAYYMAYSKGSDSDLISRTDAAFNKLKSNGVIEDIRARYSVD